MKLDAVGFDEEDSGGFGDLFSDLVVEDGNDVITGDIGAGV